MSGHTVSRVFVAALRKPDIYKHLENQLDLSISVENLIYSDADSGEGRLRVRTERLQEVEVLLCDIWPLLEDWLKEGALPRLKWVQGTWAGVGSLMKAFGYKKPKQDFILTRPAFTDSMGEYVIGQIIARERNFSGMIVDQGNKVFEGYFMESGRLDGAKVQASLEKYHAYRTLNMLHIGILGFGTIGKRVAEICKFMGMTVWAVNRVKQTSPSPHADHFRGVDSLPEVLQNVDYLCSILPSTPDTCDLLSGQVLSHCRHKKTVLINIGRGNVISEESLVHAIREGWLGGAILDVFNQEPLPADSALWELPGVTITPHCAGYTPVHMIAQDFAKNLERYTSGQPLERLVDWERGY